MTAAGDDSFYLAVENGGSSMNDEERDDVTRFAPVKGLTETEIEDLVEQVLVETTLEEKVSMLSGKGFYEEMERSGGVWGSVPYRVGGGCDRLGVPALYFTDGPRGVTCGEATCYPCSMARGASFDTDLERRIGEAMGIEARARQCNLTGAVCVNLLRHPAWGRAQETYGEDPFLLGEMGVALAEGIQAHNVMASVKHFALNSIENARFKVNVIVDERTLHEVYLPHFKKIVDAGCATVLTSFNKVNGEYCGQNSDLLDEILRRQWGFKGFVHSDWTSGVHKLYGLSAGLDVENPEPRVYGENIIRAVEAGVLDPMVVDTACRRVLTTMYRFLSAEDPLEDYTEEMVACPSHRALAREAAEKSAVLLKNEGVLPFERAKMKTLAVLGKLAALENTGDHGSSRVRAPDVKTPICGLREAVADGVTILTADEDDLDEARRICRLADCVVVVAGYTAVDEGEYVPSEASEGVSDAVGTQGWRPPEGEGGDRDSLRLPDPQVALIKAAAAENASTVVVLVAGSAVVMEEWRDEVGAVLQTFYSGMEGGAALASLLLGDIAPSGKLPFTVPKDESDLPFFDKNADEIEYGPLHGYTLMDREGIDPAFAFGFGLSYVTFSYRGLASAAGPNGIRTSISVTNNGTVPADEVVQLYIGFPGTAVERPLKLLRGFERVSLAPGESRLVRFETPIEALKWWNPASQAWELERGDYTVYAGGSSRARDLLTRTVNI